MVFTKRYINALNYKTNKVALIKKFVINVYKKQKKLYFYNRNSLYQYIYSSRFDNDLIFYYTTTFVSK